MSKVMVYLNSVEKVKNFINITNKMDCQLDLISGRYVVDGKSIMGIFSLDLSQPVELVINNNTKEETSLPEELKSFTDY